MLRFVLLRLCLVGLALCLPSSSSAQQKFSDFVDFSAKNEKDASKQQLVINAAEQIWSQMTYRHLPDFERYYIEVEWHVDKKGKPTGVTLYYGNEVFSDHLTMDAKDATGKRLTAGQLAHHATQAVIKNLTDYVLREKRKKFPFAD